jgi:TonB family protein
MSQPASTPSSKIFISYRREDSAGHTGRLYDRLSAYFGEDQIFMDIEHIEAGEDFVQAIQEAVGECEILIAIIGRDWLNSGGAAGRRLDNPNDFVRLEIATALERGVRVIPVLVQDAKMPHPQELPENLLRLSHRNAIELSDTRWKHDVDQLIEAIEKILARQRAAQSGAASAAEAERQRLETEARQQAEARAALTAETRRREIEAAEAQRRAAEETQRRREAEAAQKRREAEAAQRREAEAKENERRRAAQPAPSAFKETSARSESPLAGYATQPKQSNRMLVLAVIALLGVAAFGVIGVVLISTALTPATDNAGLTTEKRSSSGAPLSSNQQTAQSTPPTTTNAVKQSPANSSPTSKSQAGDKGMTSPALNKQEEGTPSKPTPVPKPRAPLSAGVLNGRIISQPQPAYPAVAKAARASGAVTVQVTVDESGRVISANAVSGHPLLQRAAVQAAYQARFTPTLLSGQPVKVQGVITYNFVVQ